MKCNRQNRQQTRRRKTLRLVALFFVLYMLADVSVLQAYCGNEMVGIPPAHHSIEQTNDLIQDKQETCTESTKADCRQSPDNQDSNHHHECFCWQQVVVGFFLFKTALSAESQRTSLPAFYENKHPNSDLSGFFRPPRTA